MQSSAHDNAPGAPLSDSRSQLIATAELFKTIASSEVPTKIDEATALCVRALAAGNKIVYLGNGGSAAEAMHLAGELVGRFERERTPLPALALPSNVIEATAIANDYSFNDLFRRQVEAWVKPGDIVFGLSTSGRSANVLCALAEARGRGARTIAITGKRAGALDVDIHIVVPSDRTSSIQEVSLAIGHLVCGGIERLLSDNGHD